MDVLEAKIVKLENQLCEVSNERISNMELNLEKVYKKVEKMNKQSRKNKKILTKLQSSPINPLQTNGNQLNAINEQQDSGKKRRLKVSQEWASVIQNVHEQQGSVQKEKVKRINESAHKFISSLSVHGVSRIVKTDKVVIKLVWAITIIISVSFGLYNISKSINDFNQNDVITNVERIHPKSVTFPAITICKKDYFRYNRKTFNNTSRTPTFEYFYIYNKSIDLILRDIKFKDKSYDTRNDKREIEYFKIPKTFGDCVRFNGLDEKDFETSEFKSDAFQLRLLHSYNYLNDFYNIFSKIEVYVTDNYLNSFLNSDPINLDIGNEYLVSLIKAETETKLGEPYNDCTETMDVTYRQVNCIEKCINREIKDNYNCSIPSYYRIGGLEECGGLLQAHEISGSEYSNTYRISDYYEKHMTFLKNLTDEFSADCEKECPRKCETTLFHTQVITGSSFETHFSFSFSDFSTLRIRQIPKLSSFDLVSNVGGLLGLFIGISFLSFVEVVEFLIDIFFVIFI